MEENLFINDLTGAGDLVMDPSNPDNLLAGMWEYYRKTYTFQSGGKGSGIYKTKDGGKTWSKITKGIPATTLGRIGLSYFRKDPSMVLATIEYVDKDDSLAAAAKSKEPKRREKLGGIGCFRSYDGGESWVPLAKEGEFYGQNFRIAADNRPFYYGPPRQDPTDSNRIYVPSTHGYWYSENGGKSFIGKIVASNDPHELWINPVNNKHILIAGDAGFYCSVERGLNSVCLNLPSVYQCYGVGYDMRKPYWVFSGCQDYGAWGAPSQHERGFVSADDFIHMGGEGGGSHMADPEDWTTLYSVGILSYVNRLSLTSIEVDKIINPFTFKENSNENPVIVDRAGVRTKLRANWSRR